MMFAFCDEYECNYSIDDWIVDNVTDMGGMFFGCSKFVADLSEWKVGNVIFMYSMFEECSRFSSDLSRWHVAHVQKMQFMFFYASVFQSNLSNWNVGSCSDFESMFEGADKFSSDLSLWPLSVLYDVNSMGLLRIFGKEEEETALQEDSLHSVSRTKQRHPVGFLHYDLDFPAHMYRREVPGVILNGDGLLVQDKVCVLLPARDGVMEAFQRLMNATSPDDFARERRDRHDKGPYRTGGRYAHLRVRTVYEIFNSDLEDMYGDAKQSLRQVMQSPFCKANYQSIQCTRTDKVAEQLGRLDHLGALGFPGDELQANLADLDPAVGEKLLLHGTDPEAAFTIARYGFLPPSSEHMTTGDAYGNGIYFAEDAAKSDEYAVSGRHMDMDLEMPDHLAQHFAKSLNVLMNVPLDDTLYYVLACRVMLGCAAHVEGGAFLGDAVRDLETHEFAFHPDPSRRKFHSAIVEFGSRENEPRAEWEPDSTKRTQNTRFREFVLKDDTRCLPMFLVAYERIPEEEADMPHNYADLDCL